MSSLQFQGYESEEQTPQQVFSLIFLASQLTNIAIFIFLPHLLLIVFKIVFIISFIINLIGCTNEQLTLIPRILDSFGLLEIVSFLRKKNYPYIRFTEKQETSLFKLMVKSFLPFIALVINYLAISKNELLFINESYLYLLTLALLLNAIMTTCYFSLRISDSNQSYFIVQHSIIILQTLSHVGLIYLCISFSTQYSFVHILAIRLISNVIQGVILISNDQHPYSLSLRDRYSILFDLVLKNWVFYPQNFGPFFKLGYYRHNQIYYNDEDQVVQNHSYQINYFLRIATYLEMVTILVLNLTCNQGVEDQYILYNLMKIIIYSSFIVYSFLSFKYFIDLFRSFRNSSFKYLTLKYATPQQINRLLQDTSQIIFLNILQVNLQNNQPNQQQINQYRPLANQETEQAYLMKKLFSIVYQEQSNQFEQRIKVGNFFSVKGDTVYLGSANLLEYFLKHIRESKIPSQRKISIHTQNRKLFNLQLNQALFERLFKVGFDNTFFKQDIDVYSSQIIAKQYISQQLQLVAFKKLIQANMLMNPNQILYDLYE